MLPAFIQSVREAGCDYLIVHARKAWLQGLSPKENRDIPPLDYDLVLRMAEAFADLPMSINGGIETLDQAETLLARGMDGVMIGRAAYHRPWDVMAEVDTRIFDTPGPARTREDVVDAMRPYIADHLSRGGRLHQITRHMLGLYAGQPGARLWRRLLSERANRPGADASLLDEALDQLRHPDRLAG